MIRRLPPGGTTDIYVARGLDSQVVVIRLLRPEFASKKKWRQLFFQGFEIMQSLDHPNIVRGIAIGDDADLPYAVIEYIDSQTLRSQILHRDEIIPNNLLFLLRQMASALYHVHSMGYLHLDFKPDNILLDKEAHLTLIDFDLALPLQRQAIKLKELDGTPPYLPRETLLKHTVDERTDIYALGVTAFEMITHRKPFGGHSPKEARTAQTDMSLPPGPLAGRFGAVTSSLESLIYKCLAKDPKERYPAMSLVVKALDDLV